MKRDGLLRAPLARKSLMDQVFSLMTSFRSIFEDIERAWTNCDFFD